jgi:hypothetical protein
LAHSTLAPNTSRHHAVRESSNANIDSKLVAHSLFELEKKVMRWRIIKLEIGSLEAFVTQIEAGAQETRTGTKLSTNARSVERNDEILPKFGIQKDRSAT